MTVYNDKVQSAAVQLAEELKHICNLDMDILEHNGELYIIDLNPRFGGGYPATHESGNNLLKLVMDLAEGKTIAPRFENYEAEIYIMKEVSVVRVESILKGV